MMVIAFVPGDHVARISARQLKENKVREKLEELGVDLIRAKLIAIMEVRDFVQQHEPIPLGDAITATRQQLQQWLTEKATEQIWYLRWTFIAAVAAVVVGFFGILATILVTLLH